MTIKEAAAYANATAPLVAQVGEMRAAWATAMKSLARFAEAVRHDIEQRRMEIDRLAKEASLEH